VSKIQAFVKTLLVPLSVPVAVSGQVPSTGYQYDGAGLIEQITYPSGRTVEYSRDAAGQVESVTTGFEGDSASLIDSIERAPFGPITGLTWGNSLKESRGLDLNYRVTSIEVPGVLSLDYGYTVDSNIAGIDDLLNSAASQSFDFDPVDRLTEAQGLFGLLEYDYDASGNRTALTRDGQTEDYRIHYGNNQLLEAGPVDNTYDDNGNLTDRDGDLFTYDTQNRLVGASVDRQTALYTYNHLNQRVTKTVAGTTTLFLYDGSGNLIAEVDEATGQTLAEYVWLDGSPVAYVEDGQRYQVHVDHLGTPKVLTDSAGTTAWEAHHSPFGKAEITSQGPTFNLRFPGQYFDAETGLHYNWRRYYDPNTGRYITSDPIGLAGGINTYAYAFNRPTSNVDPSGLISWEGDFRIATATFPFGATFGWFNLESECADGVKAEIEVMMAGPAIGKGLEISGSDGQISFEDHETSVKPWVFEGVAGSIGAGLAVGEKSLSFGKIRLGSAFERPPEDGRKKGIDLSVSASLGSSTLMNYQIEGCICE
jgi:RHS repeat-associated protein